MTNATERFSDRVADYVKYRPGYPDAAIDAIAKNISRGDAIADVGSGTGISAKPFLDRGFRVKAIEPNADMRAAAESALGAFSNFESVNGTAEKTTLTDASVNLVFAAQAFHWFRSDDARREIVRITKAPHLCALMWNERLTDTDFLRAYEAALMSAATDYAKVDHRNIDRERLDAFFRGPFETLHFENSQRFDRTGFMGRAFSSSYVPKTDAMREVLDQIFEQHAKDDHVQIRYTTGVYIGKLE